MGIISGLYKTGKFGLFSTSGRIMTGAVAGGVAGYMAGDQYSSTNSNLNRAMVGAVAGAAAGAGISAMLNRGFWKSAFISGMSGAKLSARAGNIIARIGSRPGVIGAGLATAGIAAGMYGLESIEQSRRVARFQASTQGLVQGSHNGRHG